MMLEQLPGETADAVVDAADVGLAIRDALATFPADEVHRKTPSSDGRVLESSCSGGIVFSRPQHGSACWQVREL
jgi:hypothetical protein